MDVRDFVVGSLAAAIGACVGMVAGLALGYLAHAWATEGRG